MSDRPPYPKVSNNSRDAKTIVRVNQQSFGGDEVPIIAGPCAVENEEQIDAIADFLSQRGIQMLRGGAYKPRTSPYSFQGLEEEGLKIMRDAANRHGLSVVTEVMDLSLLDKVQEYADVIQIGARNMKNYYFLKHLGKLCDKPILLKRSMASTLDEWLLAAEYILNGGNEQVVLCERGIRTFDTSTRNTFDIASIVHAKLLTHLPVIGDPSQGTGMRDLVGPSGCGAIGAGADGLMIEIHPQPEEALSDGPQSLTFEQFDAWLPKWKAMAKATGRKLAVKNSALQTETK